MSSSLRVVPLGQSLSSLLKSRQPIQRISPQLIIPESDLKTQLLPITPSELFISEAHAEEHLLKDLILKEDPLSLNDIQQVLDFVDLDIHIYPTGAMPASTQSQTSYSKHAWTRDTMVAASRMYALGFVEEATLMVTHLWKYYAGQEDRWRFMPFVKDKNEGNRRYEHTWKENLPQIRMWLQEDGQIVTKKDHQWPHAQPDGIYMLLDLTFEMACNGDLDLAKLTKEIGDENHSESILSIGTQFANNIKPWDLTAHGPWEDHQGYNRLSWLSPFVSGMEKIAGSFKAHVWDSIKVEDVAALQDLVACGSEEGKKALETRVPQDGSLAIETDNYNGQNFHQNDAAILFGFLFNPGLNVKQIIAIFKTIYEYRIGKVAISRRDDDLYLGRDYNKWKHEQGINTLTKEKGAQVSGEWKNPLAEWIFPESVVAEKLFDMYLESAGKWEEPFYLAQKHLKRCISLVPSEDYTYRKEFHEYAPNGTDITVPGRKVGECWSFNSSTQTFVPRENSPLPLATAPYAGMLQKLILATKLWNAKHTKTARQTAA